MGDDWTTPYTTTVHTFNRRGQVTKTRQYAGSDTSTTYQDTTAEYDGFGRMTASHKPEQQDGNGDPAYTSYNYNADGSISSVTDARGAATNYQYNSRGLLVEMYWTVPIPSTIPVPQAVEFEYDTVGNRTSMTDGAGGVTYEYNELSQMVRETRDFTDNLPDAPVSGGKFELVYAYTLGGQLKSYTDPYGQQINYTQDKIGRLNTVTGSSFGGVTDYVSNPAYRAWGALKHLEYGNGFETDVAYNNRLQAEALELTNPSTSHEIFDKSYQYYADGRLKLADESTTWQSDAFDRHFTYDQLGRVKKARTGIEAHGQTETDPIWLPYRQDYSYNALGNLTGRDSTLWNYTNGDWDFAYVVTNNRVAGQGYDADGRATSADSINFGYNAAGQMVETSRYVGYSTQIGRDGLGNEFKRTQSVWDAEEEEMGEAKTTYLIFSSVLGRVVTEAFETGKKRRTFVVAAGSVIARQVIKDDNVTEVVGFEHKDASGLSTRSSSAGTASIGGTNAYNTEELDALGNNVGIRGDLHRPPHEGGPTQSPEDSPTIDDMTMGDCTLDGIPVPCSMAMQGLNNGSALPAQLAQYQTDPTFRIEFSLGRISYWWQTETHTPGYVTVESEDGTTETEWDDYAVTNTTLYNAYVNTSFLPFDDLIERLINANDIVSKHVKFIKHKKTPIFNDEENQKAIKRSLIWMLASKECEKAFKDAGLKTPAQAIMARGLTIAGAGILLDPVASNALGIPEKVRQAAKPHVDSLKNQAFTIDIKGERLFTFFKNRAFEGASWLWGRYALEEIVVHESIHVVGEGKHESKLGGHDLSGFLDYATILAKCRIDE